MCTKPWVHSDDHAGYFCPVVQIMDVLQHIRQDAGHWRCSEIIWRLFLKPKHCCFCCCLFFLKHMALGNRAQGFGQREHQKNVFFALVIKRCIFLFLSLSLRQQSIVDTVANWVLAQFLLFRVIFVANFIYWLIHLFLEHFFDIHFS